MNIALPILLLVFGGLTFWILNESTLKWYIKSACISVFCIFTVIFWTSIHTFLGWPALENDMPEKVLVHWVIVKEPNKYIKSPGRIYVLLEAVEEPDSNFLARFFGYRKDRIEPRLYGLKYSRGLHERIQKELMPGLRAGQPVVGKFVKGKKKKGTGKKKSSGSERNGKGSESQEQDWEFHKLRPSEIHNKPER